MKYATQMFSDGKFHPGPLKTAEEHAQDREALFIIALLIATVTYQLGLCFINTHGLNTSRAIVGVSEASLYLACLPFLVKRFLPGVLILALCAAAMLCVLSLVGGSLNIKPLRDLIIPIFYFWLGCNIGKPALADRALMYIIAIVLFFGLAETFFLDQYTNIFNIFNYYVSTGNLAVITDYVRDNNLQMNGMRPEGIGRTLLPGLLGPHRVSSVFLEPVSLGNFATICAAWGLSRDKAEWRNGLFFLTIAIVLMVLSDSRFALLSVSLMVAMRFTINGKALNLAVLAPFACILLLLYVGMHSSANVGDNFEGRLAKSGGSLLAFSISDLMGTSPGENFGDQGYAYAFSSFGVILSLLFWFSFWLLPLPDERGLRFRAFVAIYVSLILCISGTSLFALKTAGIVWFLLGCCVMSPVTAPKKIKANLIPAPADVEPEVLRRHHVS